jgi:crossover junction endodeoxyribonuclease RuvC
MMPGLLALDLGGQVGFAFGAPGGLVEHGSVRLPSDRGNGRYFAWWGQWLADHLDAWRPQLVVYEAPIITGAKTHFQTAFRLIGLAAVTLEVATNHGARCEPANNSKVKKFATGNGRAGKSDMIAAMQARGWEPDSQHAADALGVFLWAEAHWAPKAVRSAGPLFGR